MKSITKASLAVAVQIVVTPLVAAVVLSPASAAIAQTQPASSFAAARATWSKIQASAADLDKKVKAGKLGDVHEVAFAIRDHVVTLPAKSAFLSSDKKNKLAGYVKTISETAGLLDKYGDSNNAAGVKAQQERMKATLKSIQALYPSGAFAATYGTNASPMRGMKMGSGDHNPMKKEHHEH